MAKANKGTAAKATTTKPGRKAKAEPVVVNPHGNRGTPTAAPVEVQNGKPTAKVQKQHTVAVATVGSAGVATRASVGGFSITAVLRQLAATAYPAFTVKHATALVAALGVPLRPNCLNAQVGSGRSAAKNGTPPAEYRYGPPAQLPKEELKRLLALAGL
jgi:hypothetical protein